MSAIIDLLRQEHRSLARLLKVLEHQLAVFDRGESPDYEVFIGVLDYCQTYSDRYHHPKEDLVFERLQRRNPAAADAFGDLAAEHAALAELTGQLATAVSDILAEAEVPQAIAQAFREGNLGIMDYYNIKNIQADTSMRRTIGGEEDPQRSKQPKS